MYDALFMPGKIGAMTLKNRIVMAPMGNLADIDGGFSQRQVDYYAARAKGGAGLIVTGSLLFTTLLGGSAAGVFEKPGHVGRLTELADQVHRYGAKLALQFNLGGGRCGGTVSASENPTVQNPDQKCRALTLEEIHQLVRQIGQSAALAKKGEADAIVLHAYAGYLLDQFQSSQWNHRTDEYGGTLENRMRLTTELIQSIKAACGKKFPVIVKFSVCHGTKEGRQLEEGLEMCRMLEQAGADALQIDTGSFPTLWNRCIPTVYEPMAYSLEAAAAVKKAVSIPVLGQNKLYIPEIAERALRENNCDFLAIGHQLLCDPDWPRKVREGRLEDIRPCIGCNQCLLSVNNGKYFHCSVNPYLSHEQDPAYRLAKSEHPRKVLVIGAGPAGMAAAIAGAKAGHQVELWEQAPVPGGNMNAAGAPSFKRDVLRYVQYLKTQMEKAGVKAVYGKTATPEAVLAEGFEQVILAAGARAKVLPIPGADNRVKLSLDVLLGKETTGKQVVVVGGGLVGCEVACHVAESADQVTIVEFLPDLLMTAEEPRNNGLAIRALLKNRGVKAVCGAAVTRMDEQGIWYQKEGIEQNIPCDTVVLAIGFVPNQELEEALRERGVNVVAVGDANTPRKIGTAVREGLFSVLDME